MERSPGYLQASMPIHMHKFSWQTLRLGVQTLTNTIDIQLYYLYLYVRPYQQRMHENMREILPGPTKIQHRELPHRRYGMSLVKQQKARSFALATLKHN